MKYPLIAFFLFCLISSCKPKTEVPPNVISINNMKAIVWELELSDQQASDKFMLYKDSLRMEATSLYQQVFAKHKTNKASFYKSFSFYESHPDLLKVLFDSLTAYGNRQKADLYKKKY